MSVSAERGGVIAAGHPDVADAGRRLLARGGNAVDAAVGAMMTAFQAEPLLASAGGAGFMVAQLDGEPIAFDFFAAAPGLGVSRAPYRPAEGAFWSIDVDFGGVTQPFHIGPGSVAVFGSMAGLCEAQQYAGRLALNDVLQPAIRACYEGTQTTTLNRVALELLTPIVRSTPVFERHVLSPEGTAPALGSRFRNVDLGRFFEEIAEHRSAAPMYTGHIAQRLLQDISAQGGGLTADDLRRYQVHRSEPVRAVLAGGEMELLMTPPPSSGGMLIAYGVLLLDGMETPAPGSRADVLLLRAVMAETLRARADVVGLATPRREHAHRLLDGAYLEAGRERVKRLVALGAQPLPSGTGHDNLVGSTTHVSVIDRDGNACAITISSGECSGLVVPGYGVFLNNFLGEDDLNPGGFHRFPPGQRLGSTMSPSLVRTRRGGVYALGSGGSKRIRTALLQVIRNMFSHGETPSQAVTADRLHYEDEGLCGETTQRYRDALQGLVQEGLPVSRFMQPHMYFGGVHLAVREADGRIIGVGDQRRFGAARVALD